jgi:hypothetical protein
MFKYDVKMDEKTTVYHKLEYIFKSKVGTHFT